jgi:hypothetical protein
MIFVRPSHHHTNPAPKNQKAGQSPIERRKLEVPDE